MNPAYGYVHANLFFSKKTEKLLFSCALKARSYHSLYGTNALLKHKKKVTSRFFWKKKVGVNVPLCMAKLISLSTAYHSCRKSTVEYSAIHMNRLYSKSYFKIKIILLLC